jgi:hypothetical protein
MAGELVDDLVELADLIGGVAIQTHQGADEQANTTSRSSTTLSISDLSWSRVAMQVVSMVMEPYRKAVQAGAIMGRHPTAAPVAHRSDVLTRLSVNASTLRAMGFASCAVFGSFAPNQASHPERAGD